MFLKTRWLKALATCFDAYLDPRLFLFRKHAFFDHPRLDGHAGQALKA